MAETTSSSLRREKRRARTLQRSARRYGMETESFEPKEPFFFRMLEPLERPQMAIFNVVERLQTDPKDLARRLECQAR